MATVGTRMIPLNLSPKFTSPEDSKASSVVPSGGQQKEAVRNTDAENPAFVCPNCGNSFEPGYERFEIPLEKIVKYFNVHRAFFKRSGSFDALTAIAQGGSPKRGNTPPNGHRDASSGAGASAASTSFAASNNVGGMAGGEDREEYRRNRLHSGAGKEDEDPSPEDAEMMEKNALIEQHLDDLLYEAYSHFLSSPEPFYFRLPEALLTTYETHLQELFQRLRIEKSEPGSSGSDSQRSDESGGSGPTFYIPNQQISIGKLQREFQAIKDSVRRQLFKEMKGRDPDAKEERRLHSSGAADSAGDSASSPANGTVRATTPQRQQQQGGNSEQQSFGTWTSSPRAAEVSGMVPPIIRRFLPDLTNEAYRKLCQEPLFMSRNIELCERCFLLFTEPDGAPGSPSSLLSSTLLREASRQERRRTETNFEDSTQN